MRGRVPHVQMPHETSPTMMKLSAEAEANYYSPAPANRKTRNRWTKRRRQWTRDALAHLDRARPSLA